MSKIIIIIPTLILLISSTIMSFSLSVSATWAFSFMLILTWVCFKLCKLARIVGPDTSSVILVFIYAFYYFIICLAFMSHDMNFNMLEPSNSDAPRYMRGAEMFAQYNMIDYSVFDIMNGTLLKIYHIWGVMYSTYHLMPVVLLGSVLSSVVLYDLAKYVGKLNNESWFLLFSIIGSYKFTHITMGLWRDIWAVLPIIFALALFLRTQNLVLSGITGVLSAFIRGGNALVAIAYIGLVFLSRRLHAHPIVTYGVMCVILLVGYYIAPVVQGYLGSVFHTENFGDFFESRQSMMEIGRMQKEGFDTTMIVNEWGLLGVPFKMIISLLNPVRAEPIFGLVFTLHNPDLLTPGVNLQAVVTWLHIILLPILAPRMAHGFFVTQRNIQYSGIVPAFLTGIIIVCLFSMQARHYTIFYIFIPIFVAMSLGEPDAKEYKTFKMILFPLTLLGILVMNCWQFIR